MNELDLESRNLLQAIVKGIEEKKGKNTIVLELSELEHAIADYYVICEGDSTTQTYALYGSVEHEVRKALDERPYRSEGQQNAEWIILDYVSVVVHILLPEAREFYRLESVWADAVVVTLE